MVWAVVSRHLLLEHEPCACMTLKSIPLIYKNFPFLKLIYIQYVVRKSPQIHKQVQNK